jgi:hypothetical protein
MISIKKYPLFMLYKEIIAGYSKNRLRQINILYGENAEFLSIEADGTSNCHSALNG